MKKLTTLALGVAAVLFMAQAALAHFGMIIPSQGAVLEKDKATVNLLVAFAHPMEMNGLNLAKPTEFGVAVEGKKTDLLPTLTANKFLGHDAWKTAYTPKKPGVYTFYMVPTPYWEPAEDKFIQHLTKVVVPAFGGDEGWDEPLGLKTEIVPLTRPFGNYAGNLFRAVVLLDGKPAPNTDVEIEYYNVNKKRTAPNDYMVTQVVKADANGVFAYSVPWSGWWGFAALNTAKETVKHDGKDKKVELGAVFWTEFVDSKGGKK